MKGFFSNNLEIPIGGRKVSVGIFTFLAAAIPAMYIDHLTNFSAWARDIFLLIPDTNLHVANGMAKGVVVLSIATMMSYAAAWFTNEKARKGFLAISFDVANLPAVIRALEKVEKEWLPPQEHKMILETIERMKTKEKQLLANPKEKT